MSSFVRSMLTPAVGSLCAFTRRWWDGGHEQWQRAMIFQAACAFLLTSLIAASGASAEVRKIQYEGFTVWVDCAKRGPTLFHYIAEPDSGSLPRYNSYFIDDNVSRRCQSLSTDPFGGKYDVGHQVPANHLDGSPISILR